MKYVIAYVAVCAVWLIVGIAVGFGMCKRRSQRDARRVEAVKRNSQLDNTGIHHVDTRAKTPVDRPRADRDNEGNR